jgi:hypothetical protein
MQGDPAPSRHLSPQLKGLLFGAGIPLGLVAAVVAAVWLVGLQARVEDRAQEKAEAQAVALCEGAARAEIGLSDSEGTFSIAPRVEVTVKRRRFSINTHVDHADGKGGTMRSFADCMVVGGADAPSRIERVDVYEGPGSHTLQRF